MGKFTGVLLASDYDNTLLDTESARRSGGEAPRVSERNQAALRYFMEQGGRFAVATGRALAALEHFVDEIPMNAPAIICNGAALYDFSAREYLDYILSVKTVDSVEEAIAHVNRYNTKHSECIVTENTETAESFLNEVDAACVYVNASTRFTDGFEFGFGAEIGISTQKLHARGPMGLKELTSYKYKIHGNGQIRR